MNPDNIRRYLEVCAQTSSYLQTLSEFIQPINSLVEAAIFAAFTEFAKHTCIHFALKKSGDPSYIHVQKGDGCYSEIGRQPQRPTHLTLASNCAQMPSVLHELLHALGFYHTHSRPDRDSYVHIDWDNVQPNRKHNFCVANGQPCPFLQGAVFGSSDTFDLPYDFGSVLHYGSYDFAVDRSRPVITPKASETTIGQRVGFSKLDIEMVRRAYSCDKRKEREATAEGECSDEMPDLCLKWKDKCQLLPGKMLKVCKLTCGNCDEGYVNRTSHDPEYYDQLAYYTLCFDTNDTVFARHCSAIPANNRAALCGNEIYQIMCPRSCQLCRDTLQPVLLDTSDGVCEDRDGDLCSAWAHSCWTHPGQMLDGCRATCGNCDGKRCFDSVVYASECRTDPRLLCPNGRYSPMSVFCPLRCGLCSVENGWNL